ncbi:hypothetical protein, partial [Neisseria sicca]|uniref:hypothetical protein n=1 Tax=Neisseria sicca TaxID=490 RepID=UPI003F68BA65
MPQTPPHLLTLFQPTSQPTQTPNPPILTISIPNLPLLTRIPGSTFPSPITF